MATKDEKHLDATAAELVSPTDPVGAAVERRADVGEAIGGVSIMEGVAIAGHEY